MDTATALKPDTVVLGALDQARAAAVDEATEPGMPGAARVGESLGAEMQGERVAVHRFRCTDEAYSGWVWTVQLSRAPRARVATIDDVVLLPGEGALLAPDWVPYDERVRPGDLGVGDVLVTPADDPRLVLSQSDPTAELAWGEEPTLWWELGMGRPRVLSAWGREDAADRWWAGEAGPDAPIARSATKVCGDCGFWVRLTGSLGTVFGACGNAMAPDDGRVVALAHGCGAHSEMVDDTPARWADLETEEAYEVLALTSLPADAPADPELELGLVEAPVLDGADLAPEPDPVVTEEPDETAPMPEPEEVADADA